MRYIFLDKVVIGNFLNKVIFEYRFKESEGM